MNWQIYCQKYKTYIISVNQSTILSTISQEVLKDFPDHIPRKLEKELIDDLKKVRTIDVKKIDIKKKISSLKNSSTIFYPFLMMMLITPTPKENSKPSFFNDFEKIIKSQELVMLFAYLDAFMADSIQSICQVNPNILKSEKKIDWKTIISCGSRNEIINHLIKEYVLDFGWGPIVPNRLKFLKKKLGLHIKLTKSEIELIKQAENIRNIIVHNGGRISQEFINKTGMNDQKIGEYIQVTSNYLEKISKSTLKLATEIFLGVSTKFFKVKSEPELLFGIAMI